MILPVQPACTGCWNAPSALVRMGMADTRHQQNCCRNDQGDRKRRRTHFRRLALASLASLSRASPEASFMRSSSIFFSLPPAAQHSRPAPPSMCRSMPFQADSTTFLWQSNNLRVSVGTEGTDGELRSRTPAAQLDEAPGGGPVPLLGLGDLVFRGVLEDEGVQLVAHVHIGCMPACLQPGPLSASERHAASITGSRMLFSRPLSMRNVHSHRAASIAAAPCIRDMKLNDP